MVVSVRVRVCMLNSLCRLFKMGFMYVRKSATNAPALSLSLLLCDYDTDNKLFNVFGTLCDEIEVAKKGYEWN